jgi:putative nucleotidyltransferase with HDIG domain
VAARGLELCALAAESVKPVDAATIEVASSLLAEVQGDAAWDFVQSDGANRPLSHAELGVALELVADYSDLKSPWFTGHSRAVADLTESAVRALGLPPAEVTSARHAALLHDIGRAGVPNSIWDKPGRLNDDEWERMRIHAYYTDRVLRRAGSLAHLAPTASAAHENANGGGYPRGIAGETIPLPGRVLACADRYQAMLEDRPHRPGLTRNEASRELRRMALEGELDGKAADAVLEVAGHPARRRASAPAGLTPREVEVLELAARGAATKQIARKLGIAPKTAGNHIEHIYSKIGVSSRAEAALYAMQNGLLRALPQDATTQREAGEA